MEPTAGGQEDDSGPLNPNPDRTWTYNIHGVEGLAPAFDSDDRGPGGDLVTLRRNALAVSEVLDADLRLGGTCSISWPCSWPETPVHRTFAGLVAVSYVRIAKRVVTLSS